MSHNIHTVAVIGAGVIGRSFTALFLSQGLKVLVFVSEATPASAKKLEDYLQNAWPTIEKQGLKEGASIKNYELLSRVNDLEARLKECDFIAEVCNVSSAELLVKIASRYFISLSQKRKVKNFQRGEG
jgi:3-hydroxyacyl-CoA dehydrogenase